VKPTAAQREDVRWWTSARPPQSRAERWAWDSAACGRRAAGQRGLDGVREGLADLGVGGAQLRGTGPGGADLRDERRQLRVARADLGGGPAGRWECIRRPSTTSRSPHGRAGSSPRRRPWPSRLALLWPTVHTSPPSGVTGLADGAGTGVAPPRSAASCPRRVWAAARAVDHHRRVPRHELVVDVRLGPGDHRLGGGTGADQVLPQR